MLKSEKRKAGRRQQSGGAGGTRCASILLSTLCLLLAAACRQDMQDQPKMKPFRSTIFFRDGLSSRPLVEGTVPRGYLRTNTELFTGKKSRTAGPIASAQPGSVAAAFPDDVEVFPIPINDEVIARGRERYDIFCSVCHGLTGYGDGIIVRRGFRRAASFHDDRLRQAPVGHFFDAVTNGWGAMPPYAAQIAVQDRWAIISYVRALQLSQHNPAIPPASSSPSQPVPASGGRR